jgi:hypothetical protein
VLSTACASPQADESAAGSEDDLSAESPQTLAPAAATDIGAALLAEVDRPDDDAWRATAARFAERTVVYVELDDAIFAPFRQYADEESTLAQIGVSVERAQTHFFASYEDNIARLDGELRAIHEAHGQKPLVVVGQPQTSPDALATVLARPSLLTDGIVGDLVLVQPAYGSILVDMAEEHVENHASLDAFVHQIFGPELEKFSRAKALARFQTALAALTPAERALLDERTFTVASYTPSLLRTNPALAAGYLALRSQGMNDGITLTEHQRLAGMGHDLGIIPADHWDIFAALPVAASPSSTRHAFTRVLFERILSR